MNDVLQYEFAMDRDELLAKYAGLFHGHFTKLVDKKRKYKAPVVIFNTDNTGLTKVRYRSR